MQMFLLVLVILVNALVVLTMDTESGCPPNNMNEAEIIEYLNERDDLWRDKFDDHWEALEHYGEPDDSDDYNELDFN